MISEYYWLTKPGIIYGNAITAIGGFFLAVNSKVDFNLFFCMLFGLAFVIASACVFNNYIDRDIDLMMARTKNRAMAKQTIPAFNALLFGGILGVIGFFLLWFGTNPLALLLAFVGFVVYVFMYTFLKRRTTHATLVGSISGAVPIVVGYCAVTGKFDIVAVLLFAIMTVWQMPHFYSIAIYRQDDYEKAKIPVLPIVKGAFVTKIQILCYIIAYMMLVILLALFDNVGDIYLALMVTLVGYWLWLGTQGLDDGSNQQWAKKMFRFSLIVLLAFSMMISIHAV
ncbi:MAG: heme o synthase [Candidatus Doudnabacteria bacterium]|nr:heme o synthase [Candidatus Doudnabacteria bacterium]